MIVLDNKWQVSEWDVGQSYLVGWNPGNVIQHPDMSIDLILDRADAGDSRPYHGGEFQSIAAATTGTWTWMAQTPDMVDGAVFGMFLYKDDYRTQPWREYDIEFVGENTNQIELAVHFLDQSGKHVVLKTPSVIELGFDASKSMHHYGITVTMTDVSFMVDGVVVETLNGSDMQGGVWDPGPLNSITDLWVAAPELSPWTGHWSDPSRPLVASIDAISLPSDSVFIGKVQADTLIGTGAGDQLYGNGGNDTLDGGGGADLAFGGAGDDTYRVDSVLDQTREYGEQGRDRVEASVSWTLTADTEDLVLQGYAQLDGTGNDLSNTMVGNHSANRLSGLGGNDTLTGGIGADTLAGGAGNDVFAFNKGDGADTIIDFRAGGTEDRMEIGGYAGYSELRQVGADTQVMLSGTDSILLKNVVASALSPDDFVFVGAGSPAPGNFPTGSIIGSAGNNVLNGTSANNTIFGLGGNDTLDGKAGADQMYGGAGNDVYWVDNLGDKTIEKAGEGYDWSHASINWTLADDVEAMALRTAADINGTGNTSDNFINGNSGNNIISGMAGNDSLEGRDGNDILNGGTGDDRLVGGAGLDTIYFAAGDGRDTIADFVAANGELLDIRGYSAARELRGENGGTRIVLSDSDTIFLEGVASTSLSAKNFRFDGTAPQAPTLTPVPPVNTNLLVNGSFESSYVAPSKYADFGSVLGWTAISGGRIEQWNALNGVTATDGDTFVELDFQGARDGFYQGVSTTANQAYTLSFDLRGRPGVPLSIQQVEVMWNDKIVATATPGSGWGTFTVEVSGTNGADRLTIRELSSQSGDGLGALLDNFKLVASAKAPAQTPAPAPTPVPEPEQAVGDVTKIMPMGDSNTFGMWENTASPGGYRGPLHDLLSKQSLSFDFVGMDRDGKIPDADHNGYSGMPIDWFTSKVNQKMLDRDGGYSNTVNTGDKTVVQHFIDQASMKSTDIILLNVGGNDIRLGDSPEKMLSEMRVLLDQIVHHAASPLVHLMTLPYIVGDRWTADASPLTNNDTIRIFNEGLEKMVTETYAALGVTFVKHGVTSGGVSSDGVHPSQAGYDAMAASWAKSLIAMNQIAQAGGDAPADPPSGGISGTGGNDVLNGGSGNDRILGLAGDDTIDGKAGADQMHGGTGNDVYWVDNLGDTTIEKVGEGYDWTQASVNWTLAENVEAMALRTAANINGAGNAADNFINGNSGNNVISGMAGNDILEGRGGNDTLKGDAGSDKMTGGEGTDIMYGGADAARDIFVFNTVSESRPGSARDIVHDFVFGVDKFDFSAMDAKSSASGVQDFAFSGTAAAVHSVWMVKSGSDIILRADVSGDKTADFEILVSNASSLSSADFLF